MGIDTKYGKVTVENENNIGEDEPVFLIRAKDSLSTAALWGYLDSYEKATRKADISADGEFGQKIEDAILKFEEWQEINKGIMKFPD